MSLDRMRRLNGDIVGIPQAQSTSTIIILTETVPRNDCLVRSIQLKKMNIFEGKSWFSYHVQLRTESPTKRITNRNLES